MSRSRLALLAAATVVAVGASLAQAAPSTSPQMTDPAGDAIGLGAAYDIVSGQLTTTGVTTTKKVGKKKVTTYTPKNLVATLTLAAPPSAQAGSSYTFDVDTTACGNGYFSFSYTPGNQLGEGGLFVSGCGTVLTGLDDTVDDFFGLSESFSDVLPVVSGNAIVWTMPLSLMGTDLPLSSVFSTFTATTDVVDPVFGLGTNVIGADTAVDAASSDATWKLG